MVSLLGGTAVVEVIFSYPGLGNMAVSAITSYDYPLIQAYVMWIALIYMIINLLIDISYKYLDPRVKEKRIDMSKIKGIYKKNKIFSLLIVVAIAIISVGIFAPIIAPYSSF